MPQANVIVVSAVCKHRITSFNVSHNRMRGKLSINFQDSEYELTNLGAIWYGRQVQETKVR
jgi:hypothetical protein